MLRYQYRLTETWTPNDAYCRQMPTDNDSTRTEAVKTPCRRCRVQTLTHQRAAHKCVIEAALTARREHRVPSRRRCRGEHGDLWRDTHRAERRAEAMARHRQLHQPWLVQERAGVERDGWSTKQCGLRSVRREMVTCGTFLLAAPAADRRTTGACSAKGLQVFVVVAHAQLLVHLVEVDRA